MTISVSGNGPARRAAGREKDDRFVSLLARDQYMREARSVEPLTDEEKTRLFGRLARAKAYPENEHYALLAKHARARLVEGYQYLVMAIASRCKPFFRRVEWLDLVNEGSIALLRALDCFADDGRASFETFAKVCINHTLQEVGFRRDGAVSIKSAPASLSLARQRKMSTLFLQESGREPSVKELAGLLDCSEEEVREVYAWQALYRSESLQGLSERTGEGESAEDYYHFESLYAECPHEETEEQKQAAVLVRRAVEQELSPCEREVVVARYGFDEGGGMTRTLEAVSEQLGRGPSVVHTAHVKALKHLQKVLAPLVESRDLASLQRDWEQYYTTAEVATLLDVHVTTVRLWARRGQLPYEMREVRGSRNGHKRMCFLKKVVDDLLQQPRGIVSQQEEAA